MDVRMSGRLQNLPALQGIVKKVRREIQSTAKSAVTVMLECATDRTPKYSGIATNQWYVVTKLSGVFTIPDTTPRPGTPLPEPRFEDGIFDTNADAYNAHVVSTRLGRVMPEVAQAVKQQHQVSLYLFNAAPHASYWLEHNPALIELREVNQDYWHMAAIREMIQIRLNDSSDIEVDDG